MQGLQTGIVITFKALRVFTLLEVLSFYIVSGVLSNLKFIKKVANNLSMPKSKIHMNTCNL